MATTAYPGFPLQELVPLLYADDLPGSIAFYRDVLGFTLSQSFAPAGEITWCRLQAPGAAVMLQRACPAEDGPADQRGHGVIFYFNLTDIDAWYAAATARGLRASPPANAPYGMRQVSFADPTGYQLCFQSPVPRA